MKPILSKVLSSKTPVNQSVIKLNKPYSALDVFEGLQMLQEDGFVSFIEDIEGNRLWKPASRLVSLWFKRAQ